MGLNIYVYRSKPLTMGGRANDATNGGISRDADQLCLVNVEGPSEPRGDIPAAMLVSNNVFGPDIGRRLVKIVPAQKVGDGYLPQPGGMFGGNYAACSDSRVSDAVEELLGVFHSGAIPIHDRFEADWQREPDTEPESYVSEKPGPGYRYRDYPGQGEG